MDTTPSAGLVDLDRRIASRLRSLRTGRGLSLDALAGLSGVSRATLSRLENAEVSGTASVLGRLCTAYGIPLSRLMFEVEDDFPAVVRRVEQAAWTDAETGYRRVSVSPPASTLAGEVLECTLAGGTVIDYAGPPRAGLEHHLVLLEGQLAVSIGAERHELTPGDCLRYQLHGPNRFETGANAARYLLFMV